MSDDATESPPEDGVAKQPLGSWLRDARERHELSVEAVAAALHLDPGIVSALEADRFEPLGAPVFVKGHVRAVAAHLGLDTDDAMRRYEATAGDAALRPPDLIVQYQRPLRRNRLLPVLAIVAIVLIILLLMLFFGPGFGARKANEAPATGAPPQAAEPVTVNPASTAVVVADDGEPESETESGPATGSPSGDFTARLATARARSAAAGTGSAPGSAPPAGRQANVTSGAGETIASNDTGSSTGGLTLRFNDVCWYEIRDAAGRLLATGTAAAGDVRRVEGPRPFAVVLGVADAVTLSLDGEAVDIPAAARRGRSARLTLP